MWALLVAAGAALCAVAALIAAAGARARAQRLADEVKLGVEPYLRRKAAEAGLDAPAPTWTSRATPEQVVGYSGRLARQLVEHERNGPPAETTRELEMAKTQPVSSTDELVVQAGRKP
jgi:ABC-type amino acid transport substrate-binding protein